MVNVIGAIGFQGAPDSDVEVEGAVGAGDDVEVVAFLQPFVAGVGVFAVAGQILVGEIVAGDGWLGADAGDLGLRN